MNDKIIAIYEDTNPNLEWVHYVAIQTNTTPPYVYGLYSRQEERRQEVPESSSDTIVIPMQAARNIFDFKPGKLKDVKPRTLDQVVKQEE